MKKNKNIKNAKSSAIFVTIVVHLLIIVLSFSFVAVRVIYKNELQFQVPKKIEITVLKIYPFLLNS